MSKYQRTEEFKRKVRALLYYVHMTMHNIINCNRLRVHVRFHKQRRFFASLFVRVSDSGHPVTYYRKVCTNNPSNKICRFMSVQSIRHHRLLHNTTILYTDTLFAPSCHPIRIYRCMQDIIHFYIILQFYTRRHFRASLSPAPENISHFKIRFKHTFELNHLPFSFFRGLGFRLGLRSNQPLSGNQYKPLHATTQVDSYFYF